jgi:Uma2 family endonuclease
MASTLPDPFDRPLTHRDLDHLPEDGNRYEVIDGELHATPFPTAAHQHALSQLVIILGQHVREAALGKVFASGLKVILDEPTGLGPDLVYLSKARLGGLREEGFFGPPDLVVEVVSSKPALDQIVKKQRYARAGVPPYWIVDPDDRKRWAYQLRGNRYELADAPSGEESFTPDLFPGLTIDLAELWL